jgi:hypothetical protein
VRYRSRMTPRHPLYTGYRNPAARISYAVWLYFRFPLSLRMVEEMLAARGISVTYETIRQWGLKFGRESPRQVQRFLSIHDQIANVFTGRPNQDTAAKFHPPVVKHSPPGPRLPAWRWPRNHVCRRPRLEPTRSLFSIDHNLTVPAQQMTAGGYRSKSANTQFEEDPPKLKQTPISVHLTPNAVGDDPLLAEAPPPPGAHTADRRPCASVRRGLGAGPVAAGLSPGDRARGGRWPRPAPYDGAPVIRGLARRHRRPQGLPCRRTAVDVLAAAPAPHRCRRSCPRLLSAGEGDGATSTPSSGARGTRSSPSRTPGLSAKRDLRPRMQWRASLMPALSPRRSLNARNWLALDQFPLVWWGTLDE